LQAVKLAVPPVQMKPSGQGAQRGGAARRNLPGTQDVAAGEQAALPGRANLFAGQVPQEEDEEAPALETVLTGQGVHADWPLPLPWVPGGQFMHPVEP
jgi:hypothetical protein